MNPSSTRVLIVDDDRDISSLLSTLMHKEGLTNMVAHDGETALQMVPVAETDMLLVDVRMPGIDGMTVLKRVKETDPHLPVVLITAYAEISAWWRPCRPGPSIICPNLLTTRRWSGWYGPPWPNVSAGAGPIPKKSRRTIVSGS